MTTKTLPDTGTARQAGFLPGDYARNIESGWIGRVQMRCDDGLCKLAGVDFLILIMTKSIDAALCGDDIRWHHEDDLERVVVKRIVD